MNDTQKEIVKNNSEFKDTSNISVPRITQHSSIYEKIQSIRAASNLNNDN